MVRNSKLVFYLLFALYIASNQVVLGDVSSYKKECAELGFKIGTSDNSDCALKLLKRERNIELKEENARAARLAEQSEIAYLRQQQREAYELQQRSVAAQEELASAQDRSATNNMLFNGIQMLRGSGPYYQPQPTAPRAPISCLTMPNGMISCQ